MPQQRGEERREQILVAAERLFRRQGYAATSMRQIAAEAGFGRAVSGLYNHFPSKEAIFTALLASRSPYPHLLAALEQVQGETLEEILYNWLDTMWSVMQHRLDFFQLVLIDFQEFEGRTLANFVAQVIPGFFQLFSRILAFPEVRRDLPAPVLARMFASQMVGFMITELILRQLNLDSLPFIPAAGKTWLDGLVSIMVRGLTVLDGPQSTKDAQG